LAGQRGKRCRQRRGAQELREALGFWVGRFGHFEGFTGGGLELVIEDGSEAAIDGLSGKKGALFGADFEDGFEQRRNGEYGAARREALDDLFPQVRAAESGWSNDVDHGLVGIGDPKSLVRRQHPDLAVDRDGENPACGMNDAVPAPGPIGQNLWGMEVDGEGAKERAVVSRFRHILTFYRNSDRREIGLGLGMADKLKHIAINCDDVERGKSFYEEVFGWKFQPWGPPGFFMTEDAGVKTAVQQRRELAPGVRMTGFECTIGVTDIEATQAAIEAHGGKIVMPKVTLPGVGTLIFFEDPEGNLAGAMQYAR